MGILKKLTIFAASCALLLALSGPLRAAAYFVAPVEGTGMDDALLTTLRQLVEGTVSETGNDLAADAEGANLILKPRLLKLGGDFILVLSKNKPEAHGDRILYMGKLKAGSLEELDVVASRLTRSVIRGADPEEGAKVGEVLSKEETGLEGPKIQARETAYFGMGPYIMENLNVPRADNIAYSFTLGRQWEVVSEAAIDLDYEVSFKDTAYVQALQLGGCYFFGNGTVAPFLGLDMGYGVARNEATDVVFGFSGGARAGVMFFRNSSTQLSLQLRSLAVLASKGSGYPGDTGLVMTIYF